MQYLEPTTLEEALDILAEQGDAAKVMAGGQSLLILLRERFVDPEVLVGLNGIEPLRHVDVNGGARIGAMVTHTAVERDSRIMGGWPLLAAAEAAVSTVQIRNRGTLCGNVAHAFPTADPPAALIACDARVHLASKHGGEREVAAEDFFVGMMETVARPDEMVTAVSLPPQPDGARGAYLKYAVRPLDFAIVGAAARVVLAPDGTITDARIGLSGAANRVLRATEAEALLLGERSSPELFGRAGDAAARQSAPLDDIDGSADYKRRVVGVYTRRVLARALE
ncbi:MAG TPA: xanthine dehydrogenase family protein subunit M [Candidatus Limnocylindria bacterium]|nr:xanthine dehydrogenase family protein subunit M [Candidatus Limnocylindria bacterium]